MIQGERNGLNDRYWWNACANRFALAGFLFCCLLLSGIAIAQSPGKGVPFQLEYSLNRLLGEEEAARYEHILSPEKEYSWEVYIPENDSGELPGVLVYVSPRMTGRLDSRWRSVMDEQNLVYISANQVGNRIGVDRRMVLAILSLKVLGQQFRIADDRIYVTGLSGGGRVASMLASQFPEIFSGAIFICGVNFWEEEPQPDLERIRKNRFVFLTGSKDFNRNETRVVYHQYLDAGVEQSKLMVIPGMSHEHPDAKNMTEALQFLSGTKEP